MTTTLSFSLSAGTSSGNIFIPGSDLLLRRRDVIGKLEVLVAPDLNANVIHSVNNLLFDTFWNRWEFFSLGFTLVQLNTT